jgi:hypothetical protein
MATSATSTAEGALSEGKASVLFGARNHEPQIPRAARGRDVALVFSVTTWPARVIEWPSLDILPPDGLGQSHYLISESLISSK